MSPAQAAVKKSLNTKYPKQIMGTIKSCYDGDTCQIEVAPKKDIQIHLTGINTPKLTDRNGLNARFYTEKLIKDRLVRAECPKSTKNSKPNCTIYLNGEDINKKVIEGGWAKSTHSKYKKAEKHAKAMREGIWSR